MCVGGQKDGVWRSSGSPCLSDLVLDGGCPFVPHGSDDIPEDGLSSALLWLLEATAPMSGGGNDVARSHSELGHCGGVWDTLVAPIATSVM